MNTIESSAEALIRNFLNKVQQNGQKASKIEKKQYNYEFFVLNQNESVKVQVYFGKKGVKPIVQGDNSSLLFNQISTLLLGESLFNNNPEEIPEPVSYIGTDESGKGDYFGPLVIAGVFADSASIGKLKKTGVKDSKEISDNNIRNLASSVKEIVEGKFDIILIAPEKYNQLYLKIGNVNKLLAWGHARVIENILVKYDAVEAISDKFGDENLIKERLQEKGKNIKLHQFTKAEKYTAVAAASILARNEFNNWFDKTSKKLNFDLPKGASLKVEQAASMLKKQMGEEVLKQLVKLHFKTTSKLI